MEERILKWLYDIQQAIQEIEGYFLVFPRDFNKYKANTLLKRAIERNLEIIGEAVNRIMKADPEFPITNALKIIGLRNQIIHAYDNISDENVWSVLIKHLPLLKQEIEKYIKMAE